MPQTTSQLLVFNLSLFTFSLILNDDLFLVLAEDRKAPPSKGEVYIRVEKMMGCKAEILTSNPFVTPKVGSILKFLTNDI